MADLAEGAAKGRLDGLTALRDVLVASIEADDGKQTAALARQLREVLKEIDDLVKAQGRKGSLVDELAKRRKARSANPAGDAPAGRSGSDSRS